VGDERSVGFDERHVGDVVGGHEIDEMLGDQLHVGTL
jgi:hypothetical protein